MSKISVTHPASFLFCGIAGPGDWPYYHAIDPPPSCCGKPPCKDKEDFFNKGCRFVMTDGFFVAKVIAGIFGPQNHATRNQIFQYQICPIPNCSASPASILHRIYNKTMILARNFARKLKNYGSFFSEMKTLSFNIWNFSKISKNRREKKKHFFPILNNFRHNSRSEFLTNFSKFRYFSRIELNNAFPRNFPHNFTFWSHLDCVIWENPRIILKVLIAGILGLLTVGVVILWLFITIKLLDYKHILTKEPEVNILEKGEKDENEISVEHLKMDWWKKELVKKMQ